ncbi:4Fe-4S ferredoxin N-terminal domain-containing protein [Halorubrum vacuolatum]|nr:4Fe-4S ferredoxin N-terminal domain-containing protein [Halorubrum vacuolatum]
MSQNNPDPLETLASLGTAPEPSQYDQELGREVGAAARRVADGDLTEEEFHELFADRLAAEFGDAYVPPEGKDDG